MTLYEEYIKLSKRRRLRLKERAEKGDVAAQQRLLAYTRALAEETNRRLEELENADMAYGKHYNNLFNFTAIEYESTRVAVPTEGKHNTWGIDIDDWGQMEKQNEIVRKFLNTQESTVEGAKRAENFRLDKLEEYEILTSEVNFDRRKEKEFLRFLGSEEVTAAIDEFGTSQPIVDAIWDIYSVNNKYGYRWKKKRNLNALKTLQIALAEFLDASSVNRITFDQAFERVGIKIEDYYRKRPTS